MGAIEQFREHGQRVREGLDAIDEIKTNVKAEYAEMVALLQEVVQTAKDLGIQLKEKQKRAPRGSRKNLQASTESQDLSAAAE